MSRGPCKLIVRHYVVCGVGSRLQPESSGGCGWCACAVRRHRGTCGALSAEIGPRPRRPGRAATCTTVENTRRWGQWRSWADEVGANPRWGTLSGSLVRGARGTDLREPPSERVTRRRSESRQLGQRCAPAQGHAFLSPIEHPPGRLYLYHCLLHVGPVIFGTNKPYPRRTSLCSFLLRHVVVRPHGTTRYD